MGSEVGGGVRPGNRFVLCVRARAVCIPSEIQAPNRATPPSLFPFPPRAFPFSLVGFPLPPTSYPTSVGLIGIGYWLGVTLTCPAWM